MTPTSQPAGPELPPGVPAATVPVPVRSLDPFIGLSTAVHAAPGVYALLLGSGVSTAASIPTGWQIVTDLVRQAAAAGDTETPFPTEGFDAEAWWQAHGDDKPLGYSGLLQSLSPTAAGRDLLLQKYFEADAQDLEQNRKVPTAAHDAIAELVARGLVRVIVTTNFDRLLETALERKGVQAQVIHRSDQIAGMTPLQHRSATIIKLHGDYADLDKRNTIDELEEYPQPQQRLLAQILDEYGLIVCGWSGEWDTALVRALEQLKSRRYPMFWSSYRQPSPAAAQLITRIGAVRIDNIGADALFTGLKDRLNALDRLASPPLSRDIAVARLKRYLPDPVHRIDLYDLVMDELGRVERSLDDRQRYPIAKPETVANDEEFWQYFQDTVEHYRADVDTLLHLLAAGGFFGGPEQSQLWTSLVQRLLAQPRSLGGRVHQYLQNLAKYPVLLAIMTLLAAGALRDRDDLVGPVLTEPWVKEPNWMQRQPAAVAAHPWRVFAEDTANKLPRLGSSQFYYAPSHLIRADLTDVLAVYEPDLDRRDAAIDMAEYLMGVAQLVSGRIPPFLGEGVLRNRISGDPLEVAVRVRSWVTDGENELVLALFDGDAAAGVEVLDRLDAEIARSAHAAAFR